MTRSKGAPVARGGATIRSENNLFDVADLPKLHALAEMADGEVLLPAETIASRLCEAFELAVILGALSNAAASPAEHRDYLARIAMQTETLCKELGIPILGTTSQTPNRRHATASSGYDCLTFAMALPDDAERNLFMWGLYGALIAPEAGQEVDERSQQIHAAFGDGIPTASEELNLRTRAQVREGLTRGLLALPLLASVARHGERHWREARGKRGVTPDEFRRSLMCRLAALYRDAYGRAPNITDGNRMPDGPAAHWIVEVVHIAAERPEKLPVATDNGDITQCSAKDMVEGLAKVKDDVLARYFQEGWNTVLQRIGAAGMN